MIDYCYKCMRPLGDATGGVCPHCGNIGPVRSSPHQLPPGTLLQDRYMVGAVLGQGGFGITYIGLDTVLDMRIAIKEFYPSGFANRNTWASTGVTVTEHEVSSQVESGKARFLQEARVLAKLESNQGVVNVKYFFEENETAYIVMDYLDGEDLQDFLHHDKLTSEQTFELMKPVMDALGLVHRENVIHRDISPHNIKILRDGSLRLMDFGAAKIVDYSDPKSMSVTLKPGYAPEEQYRPKGKQGPWTDIYALCATMYKCITGITPEDSLQRLCSEEEVIKWPSEMGIEISDSQEAALKKGMAVKQTERYKNVVELQEALYREVPVRRNVAPFQVEQSVSEEREAQRKEAGPEVEDRSKRRSEDVSNPEQKMAVKIKTNETFKASQKSKMPIVVAAVVAVLVIVGVVAATGLNSSSNNEMQGPVQSVQETIEPLAVDAKGYKGVYDGKEHGVKVSLKGGASGTIHYSDTVLDYDGYYEAVSQGEEYGSSSSPMRVDAGTTTVFYLAVPEEGASAESCTAGSVTIEISKAKQTVNVSKVFYFSKTVFSDSFNLGAKAKGNLSYKSSTTSVAKVDDKGKVTAVSSGSATITINAAATRNYKAAAKNVRVEISQAQSDYSDDESSGNDSGSDNNNNSSGGSVPKGYSVIG